MFPAFARIYQRFRSKYNENEQKASQQKLKSGTCKEKMK
jgi:hypothetical protein